MKTLLRFAVFVLAVSAPALVGADAPPPVAASPSSSDAPSVAGDFTGTWRNDTDGGKVRLSLKQNGATWTAEASFTFQETEIPAKVTSFKVDGAKIELVLAWVIQESPGQSRMIGELTGAKIDGTYQSETPDGTSSGTWTVTRT
jgi:hypothetical protein